MFVNASCYEPLFSTASTAAANLVSWLYPPDRSTTDRASLAVPTADFVFLTSKLVAVEARLTAELAKLAVVPATETTVEATDTVVVTVFAATLTVVAAILIGAVTTAHPDRATRLAAKTIFRICGSLECQFLSHSAPVERKALKD